MRLMHVHPSAAATLTTVFVVAIAVVVCADSLLNF